MADEGSGALKRDIGFTASAFLAFNGVVGAGIFALPGTLSTQFGAFSPWLFPLFGGLILLVAIPLAQIAARFTIAGGPVAYTGAAFGPAAAFQVGWLYTIARVTALAANANVFASYAAGFWPSLEAGVGRALAIVLLIGILALVNAIGVRRAVRLLDALTVLKAAPLVIMAIIGLVLFGDALTLPKAPPPLGEVENAALLILYAFIGFENLLVPASETADPKRTIPRAMLTTVAATILLYFLVQLAYVAAMPEGETSEAPMLAYGTVIAGAAGGIILSLAALASLAGNIHGSLTATPRVTYALALSGALPRWFAAVDPRFGTPRNSILFMAGLATLLALSGSFVWLAVVSTLARLIVYFASLAALPRIRRLAGEPAVSGPLQAILLAGGCTVCLWAAAQSQWSAWRMLLILIAAGTVLYLVSRRR